MTFDPALDDPPPGPSPDDLAPLDLRWLAGAVDYGLIFVGLLGGGLLGAFGARLAGVGSVTTVALAAAAVSALVPSVISWVLITREGQSLGKRWTGIRIVRRDGGPPGFLLGVIVRNWFLRAVDLLCGVVVLVDHLFIFVKGSRALHDYLAQTWVVVDRPGQVTHPRR